MKINRRDFLNFGVEAIVVLNTPLFAYLQQDEYQLRTIEDETSTLTFRPELAEKVRKLVGYVIAKRDYPLYYDSSMSNPLQRIIDVELVTEGKIFYVTVMVFNKKSAIKRPDNITIKSGLKGAKQHELITVQDRGLDGRCDYGRFPTKKLGFADLDIYSKEGKAGLEHQTKFQENYENAIDTIMRFYEQPRKNG